METCVNESSLKFLSTIMQDGNDDFNFISNICNNNKNDTQLGLHNEDLDDDISDIDNYDEKYYDQFTDKNINEEIYNHVKYLANNDYKTKIDVNYMLKLMKSQG